MTELTAASPIDGRPAAAVAVPLETLLTIRMVLVDCDSELSAQSHGRPASRRMDLQSIADHCRQATSELGKLHPSLKERTA